MALFLTLTGLTGAVISWDHELDALLNAHLLSVKDGDQTRSSLQIAQDIEQRYPSVQVTYVPLAAERGHSLGMGVEPRVDPKTKQPHDVAFNQVFVDPTSGAELGKREWGAVWPVTSENFVSFLYKFHYSLHLPAIGGTDRWGVWLLGIVGILWTLDCFVGFYLTLPTRRRKAKPAGEFVSTRGPESKTFWQRWKPSWLRARWCGLVPHQLRPSSRIWLVDVGAFVRHRLHGVLNESVSRGVFSRDDVGLERYSVALRRA